MGNWAVVTGASGGIGLDIARELAARGYALVLSARGENKLQALAEELRQAHGTRTLVAVADWACPAARTIWRSKSRGPTSRRRCW